MKIPKLNLFLVIAICIGLTFACKDDESDGGGEAKDCSVTRSYMADVVPIISKTCAIENCHVAGFFEGDYTMYDVLKAQEMEGVLKFEIEEGTMPPSNTAGPKELTDSERNTLLCWIEDGAQNN